MTEEKADTAQKTGRVKVSFYIPEFVYNNFLKKLGIDGVKDGKIQTLAVNSIVKLFALHFAAGKAGLDITFNPKPEELKKVA